MATTNVVKAATEEDNSAPTEDPLLTMNLCVAIDEHPKSPEVDNPDVDRDDRVTREITSPENEPSPKVGGKNRKRRCCPFCSVFKSSYGYISHIKSCKNRPAEISLEQAVLDATNSFNRPPKPVQEERKCPICLEFSTWSAGAYAMHTNACKKKQQANQEEVSGSVSQIDEEPKAQTTTKNRARDKKQPDVAISHIPHEKYNILKQCPHCKEKKSPFGYTRHVWACSRKSSIGIDHTPTKSKKQPDNQDEQSDASSSHVVRDITMKLCPHCKKKKSPFGYKRHVWACARKSSSGIDHAPTESETSNEKQPDNQDEYSDASSSHVVRELTTKLCPHCKEEKSPFGFKRHVWACARKSSLGHDQSPSESEKASKKQDDKRQCPFCKTWKSRYGIFSHIKWCKKKHEIKSETETEPIQSSDDKDNNNMDETPRNQPTQRKRKFTQFFNPDPCGEQQLKRQSFSNSAPASASTLNDTGSETRVATNSIGVTNGGQTWTTGDECMLLLIALDNPKQMIESGAGVWMLEAMNNNELSGESIATHWAKMLNRTGENVSRDLASTNAQTTAIHVMAACFAAEANEAKNVALLSAGWQYSPPANVSVSLTTSKSRGRPKSGELMAQKGIWRRPRPIMSPNQRSKASRRDCVESLLSLRDAWTEHMNELREGIVAGLPPRKSIKKSESAHKTETPYLESGIDDTNTDSQTDDLSISSSIESEMENRNEEIENTNDVLPMEILVESSGFLNDLDESQMSKNLLNVMKKRSQYAMKGDPRPNFKCAWCGPKSVLEKETTMSSNQITLCSACHLLIQNGWTTNSFDKRKSMRYRYTFRGPVGQRTRSIMEFVSMSSEQVVKLLSSDMEEERTEMSDEDPKIPEKITTAQSRTHQSKTVKLSHAPLKERRHSIHCPSIHEVLELEEGLAGLLRDDEFHMFNRHYGSDANIALYMLSSLAKGVLPMEVLDETPFFRSEEELNFLSPSGGAPPTRFIGVLRVVEETVNASNQIGANRSSGKFGVAFPRFEVDYAKFDENKIPPLSLLNGSLVNGRPVMLRKDIEREDVAGQLYAFSIRLLYGKKAMEEILKETNDMESRIDILHDTLNAFGAVPLRREKVHSDDAEKNIPEQSQDSVAASTT